MALDLTGLQPLDASGLKPLDTEGLTPLDLSGLTPLDQDVSALDALDTGLPLYTGQPGANDGRLKTAGSQLARGFGTSVSGFPKSIALMGAPDPEVWNNLDRIDRGERYVRMPLPTKPGASPQTPVAYEGLYQSYEKATPEERQQIRSALDQRVIDAQKSAFYEAGSAVDRWFVDNFPVNPEFQNDFWTSKLPQGIGSSMGFLASSVIGRGVFGTGKLATYGSPALFGSAMQRTDSFEQALNDGATIGEAINAAGIGSVVGLSEAAPIGHLLNRLDKVSGGVVKRLVVRAVQQGTEEGLQEAISGIITEAAAQHIYDPQRGVWTADRLTEAEVGFTTGALLEVLTTLAMPGRARGAGSRSGPVHSAEELQGYADSRISELNVQADQAGLSPDEQAELDFLREQRNNPRAIAQAYGVRLEPTRADAVQEELDNLTPEDRESPIPDELIAEGRAVTKEALREEPAAEAPDLGTVENVTMAGPVSTSEIRPFSEISESVTMEGGLPKATVTPIRPEVTSATEKPQETRAPEAGQPVENPAAGQEPSGGAAQAPETAAAPETTTTPLVSEKPAAEATQKVASSDDLRNLFSAHVDIRGRESGTAVDNLKSVMEQGFRSNALNVIPAGDGRQFQPKTGDIVYLVPNESLGKTASGRKAIRSGWKPGEDGGLVVQMRKGETLYDAFQRTVKSGDIIGQSLLTNQSVKVEGLRGTRIDSEWVNFAPATKTLGIPRDDMPQIKAENRGALANFLKARGIEGVEQTVAATSLKPSQAEFSEKKVEKAKAFTGGDRAILVSSDGYVLDGHHQWIAAADRGEDIRIIRLDAPIQTLLAEVPKMPSAEGGIPAASALRPVLEAMKSESGWEERGGHIIRDPYSGEVTGRTKWLPRADWWQGRPGGYNEAQTARIIDRGLAGEKLGPRQREYFNYLVEVAQDRSALPDLMPTVEELRESGLDETQQDADAAALVARATEISEDEVERLATRYEDDDAGFLDAIRRFVAESEAPAAVGQEDRGPAQEQAERLTLTQPAAAPESGPPVQTPTQQDLLGDETRAAQAIADETRRRDRARNQGQESAETGDRGDLFSQARQQTDIEDVQPRLPAGPFYRGSDRAGGSWWTTDREAADEYAAMHENGSVSERESLPLKKPATSDDMRQVLRDLGEEVPRDVYYYHLSPEQYDRANDVIEALQAKGFDGVYLRNGEDFAPSGKAIESVVVFPKKKSAKEAKSTPDTDRIEDFGEVLEGARKHVWEAYRDKLSEAGDVAAEPLSKSWPQPDYQKLLDDGVKPWSVAFLRTVRDQVPPKPRSGWKLQSWVKQTALLRDMASQVLNGTLSQERITEAMAADDFKRLRKEINNSIDLYLEVGHEKSLKGVRIAAGSYSIYKGERLDPPKTIYTIERKAKATAFSNWPTTLAEGDTRAEAIANFKKRYAEIDTQPAARKQAKFSIYSYRSGPKVGKWIIGKKIGKNRIDLKEFESVKEARTYLSENSDELVAALNRRKNIPEHRRETNDARVGVDHRNGADVSPEQFSDTFGFRGVQFGNYVEGKRRQTDLNNAYDSLLDLAGVLDVPPKALSLNGALGLAFGARGTGGKRAAAAHFEPDSVVINLTKRQGAGSLAHEWWHATDNYFSRRRDVKTGYLTEDTKARREGVRPEVLDAFVGVVQAINQTSLRQRSSGLDKLRTKPYWSTGREMSARAFESYIIAKLQDQGHSNDYLANIVSEDYWKAAAALGIGEGTEEQPDYPYPTAAEIPVIRASFDQLFDTIETRETESGIELHEGQPPQYTFVDESGNYTRQANEPDSSTVRERDVLAGQAQGDLFAATGLSGEQRKQESVANYKIRVRHEKTGQYNVGLDTVKSAEDAAHILAPVRRNAQENMVALVLDKNDKPITVIHHTKGTLDGTGVYPSVLAGAIHGTEGAAKVWFAHNHPSGIGEPSTADERITRRLQRTLNGTGVSIEGHIVIAAGGDASLMDRSGTLIGKVVPTAARRSKRVPVTERVLRAVHGKGEAITNPESAEKAIRNLGGEGLYLMDNRHRLLGFISMNAGQMRELKQSGRAAQILRAIDQTNAIAMIARSEDVDDRAAKNIANFSGATDIRLLDFLEGPDYSSRASKGTLTSPDAEYFSLSEPWYFSAVTRAAEGLSQKRGAGEQMLAMIRKQPGVKAEELEWTGLPEFLRAKKSVTKEEVVQFLEANGVQVEEVVTGDQDVRGRYGPVTVEFDQDEEMYYLSDGGEQLEEYYDNQADAEEARLSYLDNEGASPNTRYGEYQLPGGTNYREVLLTLPDKTGVVSQNSLDEINKSLRRNSFSELDDEQLGVLQRGGGEAFEFIDDLEARLGADVTEARADLTGANKTGVFISGHFDTPNILAHMRLNDRIGPNGEKILFIEEVQSDWHQKGRRQGYGSIDLKALTAKKVKDASGETYFEVRTKDGDFVRNVIPARVGIAKIEKEQDAIEYVQQAVANQMIVVGEGRVPDAPFKGNAWVELALKRTLRMAAEGGYDQVAWTTGDQQADRYDLSKQLDRIDYEKNGKNYEVMAVGLDGATIFNRKAVKPEELENIVGKDIAAKILNNEGDKFQFPKDTKRRSISGINLKVGGEGMKSFYDRTLPNLFRKVAKKLDKSAKPSTAMIGEAETYEVVKGDDMAPGMLPGEYAKRGAAKGTFWIRGRTTKEFTGPYEDTTAATQAIERRVAEGREDVTVHAMTVTDSMRDKAMLGLPLFDMTPEAREKIDVVVADLQKRLDEVKISGKVAFKLAKVIRDKDKSVIKSARGRYYRKTIEVATYTRNKRWTLDHEIIHALRDLGVIRPAEWRVLSKAALADEPLMTMIRKKYANRSLSEDKLVEEAIADMHANWNAKRIKARGFMQRAFQRISDFLSALGNAFRGQGFRSTGNVFRSINRGDVGRRARVAPTLQGESFATVFDGSNPGVFNGKRFWSGLFNPLDGVIEHVYTYEQAEAADFHHTLYMTPEQVDKINQGDAVFFWVDRGEILTEWRDQKPIPARILDKVREQAGLNDEAFSLQPGGFDPKRAREALKFDNDEAERRWQEARKGVRGQETVVSRFSELMSRIANGFARHYIHLPNEANFSEAREQLRKIEAAPQASKEEALRTIRKIVDGMSAKDVDLFTRKVVLEDLTYEVDQEHHLPFGFTPADVRRELDKVNAALRPELRQRVQLRNRLVRRVANEMVRSGVLSREQVKNPAYYRHQVLDYARAQVQYARTPGKKLRAPHWARRMGSSLDINANLLEAEFEWLQKALTDIAVADTINWFRDSDYNVRDEVIAKARASNEALVDRLLARDLRDNGYTTSTGRQTSPLNEQWTDFKKRIALGLQDLRRAIDDGLAVPTEFQTVASNISAGNADSALFPFLSWILDNNQPGSMGAAMIFKAVNQRKSWAKSMLGEKYADSQDIDGLIKRGFAPENHAAWQPEEGKLLFTAKTIPEHAVERMLDRIAEEGAGPITADELRAALGSVRSLLAVGGPKYQMVIPQELADTLNSLKDDHADGLIETIFSKPLGLWKRWVLINPRRVIKYNLNNLSGDLDAVIAGNPKSLRKMPRAIRELYRVMLRGKDPSPRYREAVERGVFDSGLTVQEIPDINYLGEFEALIDPPKPFRNPIRFVNSKLLKVWRGLQKFTWFRENWLRYAAYLDYVERLEGGETMDSIGYGAGNRAMVDAVSDPKDRAALLARELVGDYGAISHFGKDLRRKVIPFYSWLEVNTKRYWRFGINAWDQGVAQGFRTTGLIGASLGIRTTAYLTLRMAALYGLVQAWNLLAMGDEEDELSAEQRVRLHLILGRDDDGKIRTLRFQGALSDFLNWFGFEDAVSTALEIEKGRSDFKELLETIAKAPVNRILNGLTPIISAPVEMLTGKKFWPDVFRPRQIRDKWRNLAQMFSAEHEYDLIFDRPSRGYGRSIEEAVVYKRDVGENAYNRIKGMSYDWIRREKGMVGSGGFVTPRSQALYEWRLAKRYGDTKAERRAYAKLDELGVSGTDLRASVRRAHPLGSIPIRDRAAFLDTLTPEERDLVDKAIEWYQETYID